ncbi:polyadenylate-binding protein 2 [Phtheirospermum japonicum]|uniref:Polyadenylate-binding protein 2 n=1 Tax=Phtheirospermum japonicum TaxID=374723 RepID=A0A830BPY2_9LAMI|nr:polyadenylate-binding protein 2 [Phtheirospermum japonicum]
MEHQGQHELDDDVYGGDVPEDAYMESDFDPSADADADAAGDSKDKDLESMKKRLQEIEEEAGALREMQAKVEKEMGATQDDSSGTSATQAEKEEVDSRSIYVGNVDYACTPEEVQQHFQSCGTVNRVTILTDKFGQPKGFAYVEFVEVEAVQNALLLNESELHGRQLKVSAKRTNVPGMRQYRGRRPNPYFGTRRPFMPGPPAFPPYGGFQGSGALCATGHIEESPVGPADPRGDVISIEASQTVDGAPSLEAHLSSNVPQFRTCDSCLEADHLPPT